MKSDKPTQPKKRVSPPAFLRALRKSGTPGDVSEFDAVPEQVTERDRQALKGKSWRIVLTSAEKADQGMALELHGDVVFGSTSDADPAPDVSLEEWQGEQLGVSPRHMLVRPTLERLFVIDLQSTNGTFVNGALLGVNQAQVLEDGDLLTLGGLHLGLRIARRPDDTP